MIKVLGHRLKLSYQGKLNDTNIEQHFSSLINKILAKMKQIEMRAAADLGDDKAKQALQPFTSMITPITSLLNIPRESEVVIRQSNSIN